MTKSAKELLIVLLVYTVLFIGSFVFYSNNENIQSNQTKLHLTK